MAQAIRQGQRRGGDASRERRIDSIASGDLADLVEMNGALFKPDLDLFVMQIPFA